MSLIRNSILTGWELPERMRHTLPSLGRMAGLRDDRPVIGSSVALAWSVLLAPTMPAKTFH